MKSLSKRISFVLRHKPESIGIVLDENGYADIAGLIEKFNNNGEKIDVAVLTAIVDGDAKNRYSFNADKTKIRANYGHSFHVNLAINPSSPPETLYHGTSINYVNGIREGGIQRRSRNYVHLSCNEEVARSVGVRHGEPIILKVAAKKMEKDGHVFFHSGTVWLTEYVPPKYIEFLNEEK